MIGEILLNNERSIKVNNPKEYLLDYLLEKKEEIGDWPTYEQMWPSKGTRNPNAPSQYSYAYNFKTYEDAVEEAKLFERRKNGMNPTAEVRAKYKDYFARNKA
ncbi:hypothetical protein IKD57_03035 [Candidatus Saccharibacteria bacterium]|nr:hypothetical protein [Candidatus Saccharibacteria bacterium]